MPSKNSYSYYNRFLKCLKRYFEKKVEKNKKEKREKPDEIYVWEGSLGHGKSYKMSFDGIRAAVGYLFDDLIEKAPSACMGADDWFDKFLVNAVDILCPETWCGHERCQEYNNGHPYNCKAGNLPSKCEAWKKWRLSWRSYPQKEACQKCKHYKPFVADSYSRMTALQVEKINEYKCYCRAKELPEGCPKKKKER